MVKGALASSELGQSYWPSPIYEDDAVTVDCISPPHSSNRAEHPKELNDDI